jgi:glycosyltransferase involved in cell wall biosynthesis
MIKNINKKIRIAHLSYSDGQGGAPKAALRIHLALKKRSEIISRLYVIEKKTKYSIQKKKYLGIYAVFKRKIIEKLVNIPKVFFFSKKMTSSSAIYNNGWDKFFNNSNYDIINLHWINRETISIEEIGRIKKPIVWSLHDMWAFCGGENISENQRYIYGYKKNNMPVHEKGLDFNRWLWNRKLKNWNNNINLIAPSRWLFNSVRSSFLMKNFNATIIPYPITTDIWTIKNKNECRKILKLDTKCNYILIVMSYAENGWKGGDLFLNSLNYLKKVKFNNFEIILIGNPNKNYKRELSSYGFKIHDFGYIHNLEKQKIIYNASDLIVVPSRYDNLPMVASEASLCGTPAIAFNVCGLKDLIIHKKTGWLAKPFNIKNLAEGIIYILSNKKTKKKMSYFARQNALKKFNQNRIARKYLDFYCRVLRFSNFIN